MTAFVHLKAQNAGISWNANAKYSFHSECYYDSMQEFPEGGDAIYADRREAKGRSIDFRVTGL